MKILADRAFKTLHTEDVASSTPRLKSGAVYPSLLTAHLARRDPPSLRFGAALPYGGVTP